MRKKIEKLFNILEWDSKFFGYKVARINKAHLTSDELKGVLSSLSNINVRLVYWSVNPKDDTANKAAKVQNGFLADEKITYIKDVSTYPSKDVNQKYLHSYLHKPLNKHILSLALQSGVYSRFEIDKNFKRNEFSKLYRRWIERSLKGEIAIDVIVYVDKNIEKGLVTLEFKSGYGSIGLIAVDKKYRGHGVGKQLVNKALAKFKNLGIKIVKVATQTDNIVACKFYEKLGFVEESVQNVYHFWLNGQKTT